MKFISKKWINSVLIVVLSTVSYTLAAEVAIIVHPSNDTTLDTSAVKKLFLGKKKSFPTGETATLIIQGGDSSTEFNKKVLKKSSSQFKAYWSKLAFSGKGTPPKSLSNDEEVKKYISNNPNAIGYIDASLVDDTVKTLNKM